jgi:hypothetical protein
MYAENFYVALVDQQRQAINFPYYVDSVDLDIPDPTLWEPFDVGNARGSTAYVLRTGRAIILDEKRHDELIAAGEMRGRSPTFTTRSRPPTSPRSSGRPTP